MREGRIEVEGDFVGEEDGEVVKGALFEAKVERVADCT